MAVYPRRFTYRLQAHCIAFFFLPQEGQLSSDSRGGIKGREAAESCVLKISRGGNGTDI